MTISARRRRLAQMPDRWPNVPHHLDDPAQTDVLEWQRGYLDVTSGQITPAQLAASLDNARRIMRGTPGYCEGLRAGLLTLKVLRQLAECQQLDDLAQIERIWRRPDDPDGEQCLMHELEVAYWRRAAEL